MALTYQIDEGTQVKVSDLFIGGYDKTRRGVIAREVKIKQGEPLREGDVIETQRRLYNLGIFTRVTLAPQNPTGTDPDKAVDVIVEEAKRYTIAYGGGVEVQRLGGSGPDSTSFEFAPLVTFEISKSESDGPRGHVIIQNSRQHFAGPRVAELHGAECFRETESDFSNDVLRG